jgi:hypothetical protein
MFGDEKKVKEMFSTNEYGADSLMRFAQDTENPARKALYAGLALYRDEGSLTSAKKAELTAIPGADEVRNICLSTKTLPVRSVFGNTRSAERVSQFDRLAKTLSRSVDSTPSGFVDPHTSAPGRLQALPAGAGTGAAGGDGAAAVLLATEKQLREAQLPTTVEDFKRGSYVSGFDGDTMSFTSHHGRYGDILINSRMRDRVMVTLGTDKMRHISVSEGILRWTAEDLEYFQGKQLATLEAAADGFPSATVVGAESAGGVSSQLMAVLQTLSVAPGQDPLSMFSPDPVGTVSGAGGDAPVGATSAPAVPGVHAQPADDTPGAAGAGGDGAGGDGAGGDGAQSCTQSFTGHTFAPLADADAVAPGTGASVPGAGVPASSVVPPILGKPKGYGPAVGFAVPTAFAAAVWGWLLATKQGRELLGSMRKLLTKKGRASLTHQQKREALEDLLVLLGTSVIGVGSGVYAASQAVQTYKHNKSLSSQSLLSQKLSKAD